MKHKEKKTDASTKMTTLQALKISIKTTKLYLKDAPKSIYSYFLMDILGALSPYPNIYFAAKVIDELAGARRPKVLMLWVGLTLLVAAFVSFLSAWIAKWNDRNCVGYNYRLSRRMGEKRMTMDYATLDDTKTKEMMAIMERGHSRGGHPANAFWNLRRLVSSFASILGGVSLTWSLFTSKITDTNGKYVFLNHWLSGVIMAGLLVAVTWLVPYLQTKADKILKKYVGQDALIDNMYWHYGSRGSEDKNAIDIRLYEMQKYGQTKLDFIIDNGLYFNTTSPVAKDDYKIIAPLQALSACFSVFFTGAVYVYTCLKAWAGAFGIGRITQYVKAIGNLSGSTSQFLRTLGFLKNNAPLILPTFDYLDLPDSMYHGELSTEKRADHYYDIEFRDVSFKYPGSDVYVLRHVNLHFEVGKKMALVGPNGSGKTTIVKLLCRLYDPTEGVILLNGIDIRKYKFQEYMDIFSVVFQDFALFACPLGQNVAGAFHYDAARVKDCLEKAGFGDTLATWKDGLDTMLYTNFDGVAISGGEAQKIALARALYKAGSFVILDEPTAALDPIAEHEVYCGFDRMVEGRTAVYISHRLSSCRFCDTIAVLQEGEVVQIGSHEALLQEEGTYKTLWDAQAQYYV